MTSSAKVEGRVDVHAHALPAFYMEAMERAKFDAVRGLVIPPWTPKAAIDFMDAHGIAVQMLSISDPVVSFLNADEGAALAAKLNDYLASVVAEHPTRFGAFAALPVQDIDLARKELARALDKLKLDGVTLLSSERGKYLGDPYFDGLLADLDAQGAWVFVHPTAPIGVPAIQVPFFVAEYPFDTTRTFASLLVNGAFDRYKRIRWHFAHAGGTIPMLRPRFAALARMAPMIGPMLGLPEKAMTLTDRSVPDAFQRSFYDTALVADAPALEAVSALAGASQIVFGSDWPPAAPLYGGGDPQPVLSTVFEPSERERIDGGNVRAQFERLGR